jgi:trehalose 6-phosphate synthase
MDASVVIASYRGFAYGNEGPRRPGGGLIQALGHWAQTNGAAWVFASDTSPATDAPADPTQVLVDEALRHQHYDVVSNSILWPLLHGLTVWAAESVPQDDAAAAVWDGYRTVNAAFADRIAAAAATAATVVVHDYQLMLVPDILKRLRPDLRVVYFHHIAFATPEEFSVLPATWRFDIASSLASCTCGFQSPRWEQMYVQLCTSELPDAEPITFVAPVHPDLGGLDRAVADEDVVWIRTQMRDQIGERKLIARVDRADPMKNVPTGVRALEQLLSEHPDWRGRIVFAHHLVPTRDSVGRYRNHLAEVLAEIDVVNARWRHGDWEPILVNVADHRAYGLALLAEYDVLLVNPVREGMNLIAHEGPVVNTRAGVLVLSKEAGAHDLLSEAALGIEPGNVADTAAALHRALAMHASERSARAERLRTVLASVGGSSWNDELVRAAER